VLAAGTGAGTGAGTAISRMPRLPNAGLSRKAFNFGESSVCCCKVPFQRLPIVFFRVLRPRPRGVQSQRQSFCAGAGAQAGQEASHKLVSERV
jgi:hypothetical protein